MDRTCDLRSDAVGLGARGQAEFLIPGAAEIFEEQDELVVLVREPCPRVPVIGDAPGEFGAGAAATGSRFQDAGAQVVGDEAEFLRGKAADETMRFGTERSVSEGDERGDQVLTIGDHIKYGDLCRIIAKSNTARKRFRIPRGRAVR